MGPPARAQRAPRQCSHIRCRTSGCSSRWARSSSSNSAWLGGYQPGGHGGNPGRLPSRASRSNVRIADAFACAPRPDRGRVRASRCSSANVTGSIFPLALIGAVSCIAFYEPPYLAVCSRNPHRQRPSLPRASLRAPLLGSPDGCLPPKRGIRVSPSMGKPPFPGSGGPWEPSEDCGPSRLPRLSEWPAQDRWAARRAASGSRPITCLADVRASPARDTSRAMSQENAEVVRRMLRAFNDGDVERIVAESDPAVEWEEQSIPGVEPLYRGHDGARRWGAAVLGVREELGPPPRALRGSQGDRRPGDRLRLF